MKTQDLTTRLQDIAERYEERRQRVLSSRREAAERRASDNAGNRTPKQASLLEPLSEPESDRAD